MLVPIRAEMLIEDLVRIYPPAVKYLSEHGIRCLACGEPRWGTIGEAAQEKGFSAAAITALITELNRQFSD